MSKWFSQRSYSDSAYSPFLHDYVLGFLYGHVGNYPLWMFHLVLVFNVMKALLPLLQGPDNLSDIDLTASQRALLGLDPNATPPVTPNTKYMTPPRYGRSTTPRTGTPGSRGSSPTGSPLAYKASPSSRPYRDSTSPQAAPTWQRSLLGSNSRRNSYGAVSSMNPPRDSSLFAPQTPSPTGRNAGVPINSKWIYNKGRSLSGSGTLL